MARVSCRIWGEQEYHGVQSRKECARKQVATGATTPETLNCPRTSLQGPIRLTQFSCACAVLAPRVVESPDPFFVFHNVNGYEAEDGQVRGRASGLDRVGRALVRRGPGAGPD